MYDLPMYVCILMKQCQIQVSIEVIKRACAESPALLGDTQGVCRMDFQNQISGSQGVGFLVWLHTVLDIV